MNQIEKVRNSVKAFCLNDSTGHDWWHVWRVVNLAKEISQKEGANETIVELAALLHDVDDWKLASSSENYTNTIQILSEAQYNSKIINKVVNVIKQVSFKGAGVNTKPTTIEAMVVQDADRLDAIGAIGVARAFAYGGAKGRQIYIPGVEPVLHNTFEEYKNAKGHTINHFYEKLLLIKDLINTQTAKEIAKERHAFMLNFLNQFTNEWNEYSKQ